MSMDKQNSIYTDYVAKTNKGIVRLRFSQYQGGFEFKSWGNFWELNKRSYEVCEMRVSVKDISKYANFLKKAGYRDYTHRYDLIYNKE